MAREEILEEFLKSTRELSHAKDGALKRVSKRMFELEQENANLKVLVEALQERLAKVERYTN